jgi:glycosyltransferase involved in cell wall biosynthesis
MPDIVAAAHVGLSVCRDDAGISLLGSMPTKIAEFLATGRPVVVNSGLGDAARLVREASCGVVTTGDAPDAVRRAVDDVEQLLADPGTPERCRALALDHFDLDRAAARLAELYGRLSPGSG